MKKAIMNFDTYKGICDALRSKTGSSETYKASDIPPIIESISGGGQSFSILADFELVEDWANDTFGNGKALYDYALSLDGTDGDYFLCVSKNTDTSSYALNFCFCRIKNGVQTWSYNCRNNFANFSNTEYFGGINRSLYIGRGSSIVILKMEI